MSTLLACSLLIVSRVLRPVVDVATDRNTIVFRLQVACTRNNNAMQGETDHQKLYHNSDGRRTPFAVSPTDDGRY